MQFSRESAEMFVPDGTIPDAALARTTHLGISAHHDDLEIMAMEGILAAFGKNDRWFAGVVVSDGAGSPRAGLYEKYTDEQMRAVRRIEQKKAAVVGEYGVQIFLDHPSAVVKDPGNMAPSKDLKALLMAARPEVVYTHNPADKHPTHVATIMNVLRAIRALSHEMRPRKLYGCEVWRDLDWMNDEDKVVFRLNGHENLQMALVGVFDSQVIGGKRYDLATMGRRRAHATYLESHAVDEAQLVNFGMDLTPLVQDDTLRVTDLVMGRIEQFADSVRCGLAGFE